MCWRWLFDYSMRNVNFGFFSPQETTPSTQRILHFCCVWKGTPNPLRAQLRWKYHWIGHQLTKGFCPHSQKNEKFSNWESTQDGHFQSFPHKFFILISVLLFLTMNCTGNSFPFGFLSTFPKWIFLSVTQEDLIYKDSHIGRTIWGAIQPEFNITP